MTELHQYTPNILIDTIVAGIVSGKNTSHLMNKKTIGFMLIASSVPEFKKMIIEYLPKIIKASPQYLFDLIRMVLNWIASIPSNIKQTFKNTFINKSPDYKPISLFSAKLTGDCGHKVQLNFSIADDAIFSDFVTHIVDNGEYTEKIDNYEVINYTSNAVVSNLSDIIFPLNISQSNEDCDIFNGKETLKCYLHQNLKVSKNVGQSIQYKKLDCIDTFDNNLSIEDIRNYFNSIFKFKRTGSCDNYWIQISSLDEKFFNIIKIIKIIHGDFVYDEVNKFFKSIVKLATDDKISDQNYMCFRYLNTIDKHYVYINDSQSIHIYEYPITDRLPSIISIHNFGVSCSECTTESLSHYLFRSQMISHIIYMILVRNYIVYTVCYLNKNVYIYNTLHEFKYKSNNAKFITSDNIYYVASPADAIIEKLVIDMDKANKFKSLPEPVNHSNEKPLVNNFTITISSSKNILTDSDIIKLFTNAFDKVVTCKSLCSRRKMKPITTHNISVELVKVVNKVKNPKFVVWEKRKKTLDQNQVESQTVNRNEDDIPEEEIEEITYKKVIKCEKVADYAKSVKTLYLKKNDEIYIENIIKRYTTSNIYDRLEIQKTFGLMFSGLAGTGKTTLLKVLAYEFQLDLYYASLAELTTIEDFKMVSDYIYKEKGGGFFVLEDVDAQTTILNKRVPINSECSKEMKTDNMNLSYFLNWQQGSYTPKNLTYAISANHPENLDSAVTRAGRINIHIKFSYCDSYQLCKIFNSIIGHDLDTSLADKYCHNITSAQAIEYLVNNSFQEEMSDEDRLIDIIEQIKID